MKRSRLCFSIVLLHLLHEPMSKTHDIGLGFALSQLTTFGSQAPVGFGHGLLEFGVLLALALFWWW